MHRFAPLFWAGLGVVALVADRGADDVRFCLVMSLLAGVVSLLTQIRDRL